MRFWASVSGMRFTMAVSQMVVKGVVKSGLRMFLGYER
jgi:hypothetical protein